jgi:GntR family transcriptional regulator, transcriptional repressor for pyruvate dehydrogenase complex
VAVDAAAEREAENGYGLSRPVRSGNAFEETVERILQAIKLGTVSPGERLPAERELATRLKVSRDTLREAIRALAAEGYVDSRRGRGGGTFVIRRPVPVDPDRFRDLVARLPGGLRGVLVFREAVETGAATAAAGQTLTADQRRFLQSRMTEAEEAPPEDYRVADTRFHLALADLARSPMLATAVAEARALVNDLLDSIPMLAANLRHSSAQHRQIVAAVLGGDSGAAHLAMAEHLEGTAALLHGFLEQEQ